MSSDTNDPLLAAHVEGGSNRADRGGAGSWGFITKASLVLLGVIPHNPDRKCIRCSERLPQETELGTDGAVAESGSGAGQRRYAAGDGRTSHVTNERASGDYGSINKDGCLVCTSLNPYPKSTRHLPSRRKRFCHVTLLALITTMLSANLLQHVATRWGNKKLLLYTVSYTTFFGPFVAVAVFRLVATLTRCRPTNTRAIFTMTDTNVLGLLYRADTGRRSVSGYIYLVVLLSFVVASTTFQMYHLHNCEHIMPLGVLAYFCELIGALVFAAFWHVVYVLRTAMQADMRSTARFLKTHHLNDSVCRRRIMESWVEFSRLDSFIFGWLVFQISIVAFKVFSLVYWDYYIYSGNIQSLDTFQQTEARLIDVVMWVEIVLLCLPLISAGSMNIHYIWEKFLAFVEYEQNGEYWHCFKMVKHLYKARDNLNITICGCVLSIFVALNLGSQHARYWAGGICYNPAVNATNILHFIDPFK